MHHLPEAHLRSAYGRKLLLVRPDLHVAWCGDDARAILKAPPFIERHLASRGYEVVAGTGAELATAIREEVATVVEMIKAAGVAPE